MSESFTGNCSTSTATEQDCSMAYSAIRAQFTFLEGKVLTVVDAAFSDPIQRKATKDLIKGSFREQLKHIGNLLYSKGAGVCLEASGNPYNDTPI